MKLIYAEAFEKSVRTDFWEHYTDCHDTDQTDLLELIMDNLAEQPTIEAKPIVHAHWEYHGGDDDMELYGFCSHCGKGRLTEDDILRLKPLLCPYCGAQMDEEKNN